MCPIGNMHHRAWVCQHAKAQRSKGVSDFILAAAPAVHGNDPLGDRGLYPVQTIAVPPKPIEETFEWVLQRPDDILTCTIYTDGPRLVGLVTLLAVNGWAL